MRSELNHITEQFKTLKAAFTISLTRTPQKSKTGETN